MANTNESENSNVIRLECQKLFYKMIASGMSGELVLESMFNGIFNAMAETCGLEAAVGHCRRVADCAAEFESWEEYEKAISFNSQAVHGRA